MSFRLGVSTSPVLTAAHLASLHSAGVFTSGDLLSADLDSLAARCSLSLAELTVLKRGVLEAAAQPLTGIRLIARTEEPTREI